MAIHVGKWFAEFQKRVATIEQIARYSAKCMLDTTSYSIRVRAWDPDNLVHASELVGFEDLQSASDPVSHLLAAWQRAARRLDENRAAIAPPVQQPAELRREDLYRAGWTYRQNAKGEIELQAPEAKPTGLQTIRIKYTPIQISAADIEKAIAEGKQNIDRLHADMEAQINQTWEGLSEAAWSNSAPIPHAAVQPSTSTPTDPLDVKYDGVTLRDLLVKDEKHRREERRWCMTADDSFEQIYRRYYPDEYAPTPAQRAAISAHWSAELRARLDAAKQKERQQVVTDYDEDRP